MLKSGSINTGAIKSRTNEKINRDDRSPDPPRSRCSAENSVEHNQQYRAANDCDAETDQLLPKPWRKGLGREAVLMFAKKVFIQIQSGKLKMQTIIRYGTRSRLFAASSNLVSRSEKSRSRAEIREASRKIEIASGQKKIPQNQPVTALEIGI